jgi:LmbE family N-acetylglucosaminyl deacetylase
MPRYRHVYLSPHLDDAALSCGGTIHAQGQAGERVAVLTIFAGAPGPGPLSALAESFHARWQLGADAVRRRRSENRAALAELGADEACFDFLDCIYRGAPEAWRYPEQAEIFAALPPGEADLRDQVAGALRAWLADEREALVHAPLAVGNHVDHQLVQAAALDLRRAGWPVDFYEDYPYVQAIAPGNPRALDRTLAKAGRAWTFRLQKITAENLAARVRSIAAYRSQLGMLFGSEAAIAPRVRNYARRVGAGFLGERFWRLG